jgi:carboxyl-terminal processing protease
MKLRFVFFIFLASSVITLASYVFDDLRKEQVLLDTIVRNLMAGHYDRHEIDDSFSQSMYDAYIDNMDFSKRFFIQQDIDKLNKYRSQLDDQINNQQFSFFTEANNLMDIRTSQVKRYYKKILSKPFDFKTNDSIETDNKKLTWAKDTTELYKTWYRILKFQTMTRLSDALDLQEKDNSKKDTASNNTVPPVVVKPFDSLEVDARKKVEKSMDDWFTLLDKTELNDQLSVYMNSMTSVFDPHTEYFPPKDKENFDISMSGKLEGIGATLQQKDGYIKVAEIIVGSPSWLQGELKEGDVILKVAQGSSEPVDVVDMRLDNAVKLIRGKKGTEVRLTVKKVDGTIKVISIIRDVVIIEETFAKSVILNEDSKKQNIGYIFLPKFYVDFSDKTSRNCTDDMRKELQKLDKENIKGLVIDLRNNGGGSLEDVVKIAGFFIKDGPVVQVKGRNNNPYVLSDNDTSILYRGPLVFLVNQFSASASEILAAAMQDYGRAIIIGDSVTFGKGTVQRMYDLDNFAPRDAADVKPLGSLKLTVQKFYRVNGGATQLKGVKADVLVPNIYSYLAVGEREQEHYIPWDEIDPARYTTWPGGIKGLQKIKEKSSKRVGASAAFKLVLENALRMKKQRDISVFTLNLEKYRAEQKKQKEEAKKFEDITKDDTGITVNTLQEDEPDLKASKEKMEKAEKWHKNLKKDIYIQEALFVLDDMIN